MKERFVCVLCGLVLFAVSGCNTIKGLGQDFYAVGSWIKGGADNIQKSVSPKQSEKSDSLKRE